MEKTLACSATTCEQMSARLDLRLIIALRQAPSRAISDVSALRPPLFLPYGPSARVLPDLNDAEGRPVVTQGAAHEGVLVSALNESGMGGPHPFVLRNVPGSALHALVGHHFSQDIDSD